MSLIELSNLSLQYPIYDLDSRSLKRRVMSAFSRSGSEENSIYRVNALNNLTLTIKSGDRVALIGRNGAGKTTLLRVLAGVYEPTLGTVRVEGRIASLLALGLGLYSDCNGRENIVSQGVLLGATFAEARKRLKDIEEFSELGSALDRPTRTYSSGMLMRLSFAISTAFDAQVLLLDEVVGVGDLAFLKKAQQRIDALAANAEILVLASHDPSSLQRFCNRGLVLEAGSVVFDGPIGDALDYYVASIG